MVVSSDTIRLDGSAVSDDGVPEMLWQVPDHDVCALAQGTRPARQYRAGRRTSPVKFQQRYQKSHRPVILASFGVH